jgi:hypothetical protein
MQKQMMRQAERIPIDTLPTIQIFSYFFPPKPEELAKARTTTINCAMNKLVLSNSDCQYFSYKNKKSYSGRNTGFLKKPDDRFIDI